ncbi:MAG: Ig-like domain repeat protein, partial [Terracidiphilus sp.]
ATVSSPVTTYSIVPSATGADLADYTQSVTDGTLTVTKASSSLSGPPSVSFSYGAGGSIPVTLAGQYSGAGIATPSGNVTYTIGTGAAQTAVISAGGATLTVPASLGQGTYTVTVNYAGDGNYNPAIPTTVNLTVGVVTLTISANNATKIYGAPNPTFTGSVTGQQTGDTFAESFTTAATTLSPVGAYAIVPSVTSAELADYLQLVTDGTLTVTQASTITSLGASSGSITPGQSVTLTAQVAPQYTGTPTDTVSFFDGTTLLATVPLNGGVASFATTALTSGAHSLTATYNGDADFTISTSTPVSVTVAPLDFTIAVSGATIDTVIPGTTASYSLIVTPLYATYPGTVTFSVSGLPAGDTATFTPPSIPANGGTQTVVMTIQTVAGYAKNESRPGPGPFGRLPLALGLLLLPFAGARRLRRQGRKFGRYLCLLLALVGSIAAASMLSACADHNGFFLTAPSSNTLTVTGSSGGLQHSVTVTLNVE